MPFRKRLRAEGNGLSQNPLLFRALIVSLYYHLNNSMLVLFVLTQQKMLRFKDSSLYTAPLLRDALRLELLRLALQEAVG